MLNLKEFPHIYYLDKERITKYNIKDRQGLKLDLDDSEFYLLASSLISECLPKTYLEGFKEIFIRIKKSSLPKSKRLFLLAISITTQF